MAQRLDKRSQRRNHGLWPSATNCFFPSLMDRPSQIQTFCVQSHKDTRKRQSWFSKTVNRRFLNISDLEGYSVPTLAIVCNELDQDIAFINRCITDTKKKTGMLKEIYACNKKFRRELARLSNRRRFLVKAKGWAISTLLKTKANKDEPWRFFDRKHKFVQHNSKTLAF